MDSMDADNQKDPILTRLFFEACVAGDLDELVVLSSNPKVDLNATQPAISIYGATNPWLAAAANGHLRLVQFLVSLPSINKTVYTNKGLNAISLAALDDHLDIVKYLHEVHQVPLQPPEFFAADKESPLHWAALRGRVATAEYLIARKADVNYAPKKRGPICFAAYQGKTEIVKLLIKHGAQINSVDNAGKTVLFDAIQSGVLDVVKVLVEAGAALDHVSRGNQWTPFDAADIEGKSEIATYLWRAGSRSLRPPRGREIVSWQRPYVVNRFSTRAAARVCMRGDWLYLFGGYGYSVKPQVRAKFQKVEGGLDDLPPLPTEEEPSRVAKYTESGWFFDIFRCNLKKGVQMGQLFDLLPTKSISAAFTESPGQQGNRFNSNSIHSLLRLEDPWTVEYTGNSMDWAGTVMAELPFERKYGFSYFEITIIDPGERQEVALGVGEKDYALDSLPGWNTPSVALHGDGLDAMVCLRKGSSADQIRYANKIRSGSVAGMGIIWDTNEVFLTVDGEFKGICANIEAHSTFYPMVGMRSKGGKAKINFGAQPFHFDFVVPYIAFQAFNSPVVGSIQPVFVIPNVSHPSLSTQAGNIGYLESNRVVVLSQSSSPFYVSTTSPGEAKLSDTQSLTYVLLGSTLVGVSQQFNAYQKGVWELSLDTLTWTFFPVLQDVSDQHWATFSRANVVAVGNKVLFIHTSASYLYDPATHSMALIPAPKAPTLDCNYYASTALNDHEVAVYSEGQSILLDVDTGKWSALRHSNGFPETKSLASTVRMGNQIVYVGGFETSSASGLDIATISSSSDLFRLSAISDYFGSAELSDLEIASETLTLQPIRAHQIILATRSKVLNALLFGPQTQAQQLSFVPAAAPGATSRLVLPSHLPFELFTLIIKFLYTDEIDLADQTKFPEVLRLADTFFPEHAVRISEMLVLSRVSEPSSFFKDLSQGFANPRRSDIRINVNGTILPAHKVVLCAESEYFKALFLGVLRNDAQTEVQITDTDPTVVGHVLKFIYSNYVDFEQIGDVLEEVLLTANKYGVETNVDALLEVAEAYEFARLKSSCISFKAAQKINQRDFEPL